MTSILFCNDTYKSGMPLHKINIKETKNIFGFKYMESNLTKTLENCTLPKWMTAYTILNEPENYIAIHKTCKNVDIGYGLVSVSKIAADTIILDYLGEKETMTSDFVYSLDLNEGGTISAKYQGNLARFSTHLPEEYPEQPWLENAQIKLANLKIETVSCRGEEHNLLVTKKSIEKGEELGWDYGAGYWLHTFLYYLNPISGKCFLETRNADGFIKRYAQMIEECKESLNKFPNDLTISYNLTHMLMIRGKSYSMLKQHSYAIKDLHEALEISPLSFENKVSNLQLMDEILTDELIVSIREKYGDNLMKNCQNILEYFELSSLEEISEFFYKHKDNQCMNDLYTSLISISEKLLVYTNKPAGFCTESHNDTVSFSTYELSDSLLGKMCNLKSYHCEQEYHTSISFDYDIFSQSCKTLQPLSEAIVTHSEFIN